MAGVSRIKHHTKAYRELLTAPDVMADLERRAERIAEAAGPGHEVEPSTPARKRSRVGIVAVTYAARRANSKNNVLIRSIDAGR